MSIHSDVRGEGTRPSVVLDTDPALDAGPTRTATTDEEPPAPTDDSESHATGVRSP